MNVSALTTVAATFAMTTAVAEGQWPQPLKAPNWVDTITVARLPSGGCEWSKVQQRMRPGKRGTTTIAGPAEEKTCTVLVSNHTTGAETDPPSVVGFAYVQDHKSPVPSSAVLNFADTFTVARRPNGNCDWGRTPFRQGKKGSSSFLGEARTTKCWGVVYNVTMPPPDTTGMKTSVSIMIGADVWEGRDTLAGRGRQARDIANAANAVVPAGARLEQMSITDDSLANVAVAYPGSAPERYWYFFRKRGSEWVVSSPPRRF
jgi:hypothetical protein